MLFPLALNLISAIIAGPPNCVTGNITFDPRRMYALGGEPENLDPAYYDFSIDYGYQNVKPNPNGNGIQVNLVKSASNKGLGARLSSTRFFQYAKLTARMSAIPYAGAITTFITFSPRKDEIDFEFVGSKSSSVESNVFYKGILEFGIRSKEHSTGPISAPREYTIDWRSDRIIWSIDGNEVRTYSKNEDLAVTDKTPSGERSYPEEPTQIQLAVWDGGSSDSPGVANWYESIN